MTRNPLLLSCLSLCMPLILHANTAENATPLSFAKYLVDDEYATNNEANSFKEDNGESDFEEDSLLAIDDESAQILEVKLAENANRRSQASKQKTNRTPTSQRDKEQQAPQTASQPARRNAQRGNLAATSKNMTQQDETQEQNGYSKQKKRKKAQKQCPSFTLPVNHSGWFADAEFLYWKLDETGLDHAIHQKAGENIFQRWTFGGSPAFVPTDELLGKVANLTFDWNPGFRVEAGYRFARDLWELSGVYTYYYTSGKDSTQTAVLYGDDLPNILADAEQLAPTIGEVPNTNTIGSFARAHFWYRIGDIELARQFSATPYLSLRFVVGPSIAFIKQKFNVRGADNSGLPIGTVENGDAVLHHFNWNFSGGGIKVGMDSHWLLGCDLNLLFGGALSAIYGHYSNTTTASIRPATGPTYPPLINGLFGDIEVETGRVAYSTRLAGGLGWNHTFCKWNLELFAKYELTTWFNLTDQYRIESGTPSTTKIRVLQTPPLNLQGVTVGLKVNF